MRSSNVLDGCEEGVLVEGVGLVARVVDGRWDVEERCAVGEGCEVSVG